VSDMLHRLAEADEIPVESDAPESPGELPYDAALQADLIQHGPAALAEYGRMVVRGIDDPARFNSACWFALSYEPPLKWEHDTRDMTIYAPEEAA